MVSNTGTYLDTPFHRFADGWGSDASGDAAHPFVGTETARHRAVSA